MFLRQLTKSPYLYPKSWAGFSYSTSTNKNSNKNIEYSKHLHDLEQSNLAKPDGWDQAKPFGSIPGPKAFPLVGNSWRVAFGELKGLEFNQLSEQ